MVEMFLTTAPRVQGLEIKMRKFLEKIEVEIPAGAVSYSTEDSNKIIFLVGETGQFISGVLTDQQVSEIKRGGCFGSFGWNL